MHGTNMKFRSTLPTASICAKMCQWDCHII